MGQVQLVHLSKSFGDSRIISDVNLEIQDGEFVVFVGPSGCGKSTLLRMIAGLETVSSGNILINGDIVNDKPPVERGISMVFQSYALYPHLNVYENIAFPLRVAKLEESQIRTRVMRAAQILKLEDRIFNKPAELSGGQRQRVAIGRAIVREPKVFLFDEPLSNLDAALRTDMRVELSTLHKSLDATMVYVTHDQVEAMTMADKIVVLNGGEIYQVGSPLELYHYPQNRFVAGFIGTPPMNFFKATVVKAMQKTVIVRLGEDHIRVPVADSECKLGEDVELGIRPDDMQMGSKKTIRLSMTPDVIEDLGHSTVAYASHPLSANQIRILLRGPHELSEDKTIQVGFNAEDCHLFHSDGRAFGRPRKSL